MLEHLFDTKIVSVTVLVQEVTPFLPTNEKCTGYEPETVAKSTSTCEIGQASTRIVRKSIERKTSNKISVCQCEQADPGQIPKGAEASS